ncbi:MAG: diguanylate cyclase [Massilia sp.]
MSAPPQPVSPLAAFGNWLLTTDRAQRRCLIAILMTAVVYSACMGMLAFGSAHGLFAAGPARLLSLFMVITPIGFFALTRTGLNRRFRDPTLTLPQGMVAQLLVGGSYSVTGPLHAGTLILFALVMTFGMFDMDVRHARRLAAFSIGVAGAVMLFGWYRDPAVFRGEMQLIYFALTVTALGSISQLSVVLTMMRRRLKAQKLELEKALAHIQELATHDELTGLANRRHILDLLEQHALRHARGGPSFYVVMADLDHFKRINDSHGHAVGDEALCCFARVAQAQLRNTDVIGRWGGEEFLLLMPETPPGDPNVGLERLRNGLATSEASAQVAGLRVQFSAGLSRYRDGEAVGDTIERADRAVYAAKTAGRNRTLAL